MPGTMLIGYENYADDDAADYSGGSWQVPLSELKDPRPSAKARSTDLSTSSTLFRVDLGSPRELKFWAITHTNLTSAALYRLTWFSDEFVTAIANTGWLSPAGYPDIDPDKIGAAIFHVFAAPLGFRYWQAEFDDQENPAGFLDVGLNIMPRELGLSRDPDVGIAEEVQPNTQRSNAVGGTGYFNRRKPLRKLSFGYNALNVQNVVDAPKIRRLRKFCNLNKQVVVIPDFEDTANLWDRSFVGTLNAMPKLGLLSNRLVDGEGFEILEVV